MNRIPKRGLPRLVATIPALGIGLIVAVGLWCLTCPATAQVPSSGPPSQPGYSGSMPGYAPSSGPGSSGTGVPASSGPGQPEAKPALPADHEVWVKEHYYKARWDAEPRLKEAVVALAKRFKEKGPAVADKTAVLLARLIKSEQPKPPEPPAASPAPSGSTPGSPSSYGPGGSYAPSGGPPTASSMYPGSSAGASYPGGPSGMMGGGPQCRPLDAATIRAIVEALTILDCPTSQLSLEQLISGTLKTDDDRASAEASLESIVAHPFLPKSEDILFTVLTTPEKLRPEPKGAGTSAPGTSSPGTSSYPGASGSSSYPGASSPPSSAGYPGMSSGGMYGSGGQGARMSAADLQGKAFALIQQTASESLRTRLAGFWILPTASQQTKQLIGQLLIQQHPANLPAQMAAIAKFGEGDEKTKVMLEQYFVRYSSDALAAMMGIPPRTAETNPQGPSSSGYPGMPGSSAPGTMPGSSPPPSFSGPPSSGASYPGASGTSTMPGMMGPGQPSGTAPAASLPPDPELPFRLAKQLWGKDFTTSLSNTLGAQEMEPIANQILLASTVPTDAMRARLCALLTTCQEEGPDALEAAGLGSRYFSDPGFLLVLKSLDRKDPPDQNLPMRRPSRFRRQPGGSGPGNPGAPGYNQPSGQPGGPMPGAPGQKPEQTNPEQTKVDWMNASETMVHALCEQLYSAARAKKVRGSPEGQPFDIPESFNVSAEYHFNWPGDLKGQDKLQGVTLDPMSVHYVRMFQSNAPSKVIAYFKRQFPRPIEHVATTGAWLEGSKLDPDTGRRLSIDMVISKKPAKGAKPSGPGQPGAAPGGPPSAGMPGYGMSSSGMQPGSGQPGERLEKDVATDLIIEIVSVEVKAPDADVVKKKPGRDRSKDKKPEKKAKVDEEI